MPAPLLYRFPIPYSLLPASLVPQLPQGRFVVGPAFAHAHPGFQEDLGTEQSLHLHARFRADFAQARTGLADHDRLLAVALDPDHRADAQQLAVDDEALDLDR